MTRQEWEATERFLSAGSGKSISRQGSDVYYSLLCHLPFEAIQQAAADILRSQTYSVFPQIGTIHEFALTAIHRARIANEDEQRRRWGPARWGEIADRLKDVLGRIGRMPQEPRRLEAPRPVSKPVQPVPGAEASEVPPPF